MTISGFVLRLYLTPFLVLGSVLGAACAAFAMAFAAAYKDVRRVLTP